MKPQVFLAIIFLNTLLLAPGEVSAQIEPLAVVNGKTVYRHEVDRAVAKARGKKKFTPAQTETLAAHALKQLVSRQLILSYLQEFKLGATESDIRLHRERVRQQLKQQEITLEEFLKRSRLTAEEFDAALKWELSWSRYLERTMTDANLERYFRQHHREFDGTEIDVAHILWPAPAEPTEKFWKDATAKAALVRLQLASGEVDFATAAKTHSGAPTAKDGGGIGFIGRRKPMPESFTKAAFQLDVGQVSSPVRTKFGVHLIQCRAIEAGQLSWSDARKELTPAVMEHLFNYVSGVQQKKIEVSYTPAGNQLKALLRAE